MLRPASHRPGKHRPTLLLAVLSVLLLAACSDAPTLYYRYRPLPDDGWRRADTLHFDIPTATISSAAALSGELHLRLAHGYPFSSVAVVVQATAHGMPLGRDTLFCGLTDSRGMPHGTGHGYINYTFPLDMAALGVGAITPVGGLPKVGSVTPVDTLSPADTSSQVDTLSLSVYHIMRRETLPTVAAVGVRLARWQ